MREQGHAQVSDSPAVVMYIDLEILPYPWTQLQLYLALVLSTSPQAKDPGEVTHACVLINNKPADLIARPDPDMAHDLALASTECGRGAPGGKSDKLTRIVYFEKALQLDSSSSQLQSVNSSAGKVPRLRHSHLYPWRA